MRIRVKTMSISPLRIGIVASYGGAFGRELVNAILDFKFKSATRPWEISFVSHWLSVSFDDFRRINLDGLIAPVYQDFEGFQSLGIPVVNITEPLPDCPFPSVTFDNQAIGEVAAREFIAMDLPACYWIDADLPVNKKRNQAFADTLSAHGIAGQALPCSTREKLRLLAGFQIPTLDVKTKLGNLLPAGIFCTDDRHGLSAIEYCRKNDLEVPDQVSVIGVNNDPFLCRAFVLEMSSIPINAYQVGALAARQLQCLLDGQSPDRSCTRVAPGAVVRRHSSDRLNCPDPVVAGALRYIRAHISEYFDVSDILRFTPVSRRTLEKRFMAYKGKSIHQTIVSERLDHAETLLLDTDLPQKSVASLSGFPNLHAFHTAFKRQHGSTPCQFRIQAKTS